MTTAVLPNRFKRQLITLALTFVVVLVMKFVVDDWLSRQGPTTETDASTSSEGTTVEMP